MFGSFDNNRIQFNAAYFAQLEKDTNSGLNRFDRRQQNVYVANIFRQDFIRKGGANWLAAASIRWNLFDGLGNRARISESQAALAAAR